MIKKMKKDKGITLISLIITIVIILILASVATYSGINAIKSSEYTRFTTELKIMQAQVNNLYEKFINNETINGKEVLEYGINIANAKEQVQEQAKKVFEELSITDSVGYKYYDKETIKELEIEGVEQEFFVNIEKRSIISYSGIERGNRKYYTPEQIGMNNVEYQRNNIKPTFDINTDLLVQNQYKVTINNIEYEGYIDKWKVKYKKGDDNEENGYWITSDELSFIVKEAGMYTIYLQNGDIESEHQTTYIGYIQDGLLLHYDGLINTRKGHNIETTNWEDLSGNDNDANLYDCIINENNIEFNGSSSYSKLPMNALGEYKESTIEIIMKPTTDEAVVIADNSNVSNRGVAFKSSSNILDSWVGAGNSDTIPYYFIANKPFLNEIHTYTFIYDGLDYNNTIAYQDSLSLKKSSSTGGYSNNTEYPIIGKSQWNSGEEWNFKGEIYSIRVYDKNLSEEQLKYNNDLDKKRFNIL